MKIMVLLLALLLTGCTVLEENREVGVFPALSSPPSPKDYLHTDNIESVKRYYKMLEVYYAYLGGYLDFIAEQYAISHSPRKLDCMMVLKQSQIQLGDLPRLNGRSDVDIVDALIDHVEALRARIVIYNEQVRRHNEEIDKKCT